MNQYYPYQGYMPNYNPYQQNYQQNYQQTIPQQNTVIQPQGIAGKMVNDFSEVNVNDVPMDGRFALFAKNDMSEIQVKAWNSQGQIDTITFSQNNVTKVTKPTMEQRLDDFMSEISERMERMENAIGSKKTTRTVKEKVDE